MAALQKAVERAFPGKDTALFDRSLDYSRVLVRAEHPSSPAIYYLVDMKKGTADIIGETYPALASARLGEMRADGYQARDGFSIPTYVTLPPDREPVGLPLVVLPHGGPQSRDDAGFDWLAQFLATRGYVVLQPQFRGSRGFTEDLRKAGLRQWGRGMQDDITDGVHNLIERGIADAKRICIVGASFGGYAALAGAAFTPDLYACAVSINGIADLAAMFGYVRSQYGDESDALAYWKDTVGSPRDEDVAKFSPVRAVDSIKIPILLVHAKDDTAVPHSQSANFAKLLQASGKPHQLIELTGEDHWLSSSDSRLRVLDGLEAFLSKYLQPTAP